MVNQHYWQMSTLDHSANPQITNSIAEAGFLSFFSCCITKSSVLSCVFLRYLHIVMVWEVLLICVICKLQHNLKALYFTFSGWYCHSSTTQRQLLCLIPLHLTTLCALIPHSERCHSERNKCNQKDKSIQCLDRVCSSVHACNDNANILAVSRPMFNILLC